MVLKRAKFEVLVRTYNYFVYVLYIYTQLHFIPVVKVYPFFLPSRKCIVFYQSCLLDFLHRGVFLIWFYIPLLFQFYLCLSFKTFYFWSVWEILYYFFFKELGLWGWAGKRFRGMESIHIYQFCFLSTWLAYTWPVENHLIKKGTSWEKN